MEFGVPNQRRASTKVEKHNFAVATTVIAEEKKARGILFNTAAVEALGLPEEEAQVAFAFDQDNHGIYVVNATDNADIPEEHKINVTKSQPRRIADKRTYEYIIKLLDLSDQVENEFRLADVDVNGTNMLAFQLMVTGADTGYTGADAAAAAETATTGTMEVSDTNMAEGAGEDAFAGDPFETADAEPASTEDAFQDGGGL